jgi:hypothetical protein
MAEKLFHWDCVELERIKGRGDGDGGNGKARITNSNIDI